MVVTDEELYDHVRSGGAGVNPDKRKYGDPGIRLEQLMRFFDPKLARRFDDSDQVCCLQALLMSGLFCCVPIVVCFARIR